MAAHFRKPQRDCQQHQYDRHECHDDPNDLRHASLLRAVCDNDRRPVHNPGVRAIAECRFRNGLLYAKRTRLGTCLFICTGFILNCLPVISEQTRRRFRPDRPSAPIAPKNSCASVRAGVTAPVYAPLAHIIKRHSERLPARHTHSVSIPNYAEGLDKRSQYPYNVATSSPPRMIRVDIASRTMPKRAIVISKPIDSDAAVRLDSRPPSLPRIAKMGAPPYEPEPEPEVIQPKEHAHVPDVDIATLSLDELSSPTWSATRR